MYQCTRTGTYIIVKINICAARLVGLLLVLWAALLLSAGSADAAPYPGGSIFGGNYAMKRSGQRHTLQYFDNTQIETYLVTFILTLL
jgi:hypothetical protein